MQDKGVSLGTPLLLVCTSVGRETRRFCGEIVVSWGRFCGLIIPFARRQDKRARGTEVGSASTTLIGYMQLCATKSVPHAQKPRRTGMSGGVFVRVAGFMTSLVAGARFELTTFRL